MSEEQKKIAKLKKNISNIIWISDEKQNKIMHQEIFDEIDKAFANGKCDECGDVLVIGENIHKGFHCPICRKCRQKILEKQNE